MYPHKVLYVHPKASNGDSKASYLHPKPSNQNIRANAKQVTSGEKESAAGDVILDAAQNITIGFETVEAGAFQNYVNAEFSPRKFCCFCFCVDGDLFAVDDDVTVFFDC